MITTIRYGNTNTYLISSTGMAAGTANKAGEAVKGGLLIDTDYAGTLTAFYRALKASGISLKDIGCVMATHYHPDHMGIIGDLQQLGIPLTAVDVQLASLHFADGIFAREKHLRFTPVDEASARVITLNESRSFLNGLGIDGEILHTPSHSPDSISVVLDSGECIVGDLEPLEYLEAYGNRPELKRDWDRILSFHPGRILSSHVNEKRL